MIKLTKHAKKRLRQRGISLEQLIYVFIYGACKKSKGLASYYYTKESGKLMLADGIPFNLVDKCRGIYIIAKGALIITICHTKR